MNLIQTAMFEVEEKTIRKLAVRKAKPEPEVKQDKNLIPLPHPFYSKPRGRYIWVDSLAF